MTTSNTAAARETDRQTARMAEYITEIEGLIADFRDSLAVVPSQGAAAFRGTHERATAQQIADVAAKMGLSAQSLTLIDDETTRAAAQAAATTFRSMTKSEAAEQTYRTMVQHARLGLSPAAVESDEDARDRQWFAELETARAQVFGS